MISVNRNKKQIELQNKLKSASIELPEISVNQNQQARMRAKSYKNVTDMTKQGYYTIVAKKDS
jgi:hypothetical protein